VSRLLPLLLVLLLPVPEADAWGPTGHRVTGALAERWLSPQARAGITALLGTEDLARAATWADEMRSAPGEFWQRTANPWHYVTVPPGRTYEAVGAPEAGDAFTALERFAATLRDPDAPAAERRLALRFAVHLVGDLHQPLHVGNGRDRGGNDVRVRWFGEPTNLHRLWDSQLIEHEGLAYTEWSARLARAIEPAELAAWSDPDPRTWIAESAALRPDLYPEDADLSWDYAFAHRATLERRLAQAGVRLAVWLDAVFEGVPVRD
jgi:hypothetical protein